MRKSDDIPLVSRQRYPYLIAWVLILCCCHSDLLSQTQLPSEVDSGAPDPVPLAEARTIDPLTLVSVSSRGNPNGITVTFSKPVSPASALDEIHYEINAPINLLGASFGSSQNIVQLHTSRLDDNTNYIVTVWHVIDLEFSLISPNPSSASFVHGGEYPKFQILLERFDTGPGSLLSDLTNHHSFPNEPSWIQPLPNFEIPIDVADFYGSRLSGTFLAPDTGFYRFYLCSDDQGAAFLAEDGLPVHKQLIAFEPQWNASRDYLGTNRRNPSQPENRTNLVHLVQGQEVYLEALAKEEIGADNLSLAVQLPGTTSPPSRPISAFNFLEQRYYGGTKFKTLDSVFFTLQPANQIVHEGQPVTVAAAVDGTPPYQFQWFKNGLPIQGATGPIYTSPASTPEDHGATLEIRVSNEFSSAISDPALLRVIIDDTPPVLVRAVADPSFRRVMVSFSEAIDPATGTDRSHYSLVNYQNRPWDISFVSLQNGSNALLELDWPMEQNQPYRVTVRDVRDASAAGNVIPTGSQTTFSSWIVHQGLVLQEYYDNVGTGNAVDLLTTHPKFPDHPDQVLLTNTFATVPNRADSYGVRVSGYFAPFMGEDYRFFARGDDDFQFWLSEDNDPANRSLLIHGLSCCQPFSSNASPVLFLQHDELYYFEGLLKDNFGGDYLYVAADLANSQYHPDSLDPIPDYWLACAANPDGADQITITQHPANTMVEANQPASFSVAASSSSQDPPFIQWQFYDDARWEFVPGISGPRYTTPPVQFFQDGLPFRAVINVPGRIVYSQVAVLRVTPDQTPPRLLSASSVDPYRIGLCFSEQLDPQFTYDPANYMVPDNYVLMADLLEDGRFILLQLENPVSTFSVSVRNLRDLAGNEVASGSIVAGRRWADQTDVGIAAPVGQSISCREGDVSVTAGGSDIWETADEFHFVYQPVRNDFDVRVKVDRLDPTHPWSKTGLMARQYLTDNSPNLHVVTAPTAIPGVGVLLASRRVYTGEDTIEWGDERPPSTLPNLWLRLHRTGDVFAAFYSTDGLKWIQFGETTQQMPPDLLVGMATASHNVEVLTQAELSQFHFHPTGPIILEQPRSQIVQPDSTVILNVLATGPGPFQYQWRLNGNNLPGQTNDTLVLSSVTPRDAGSFSVVVLNAFGIETSVPADVLVTARDLPFEDDLDQAILWEHASGEGIGSNLGATLEKGEPDHAGKTGGSSVWLAWRPDVYGLAALTTAGSSFDTLLAVYRGSSFDNLVEVASNDDSGRHYTSSVRFNAIPEVTYYIAVDGLAGAAGNIVLSYNVLPSPDILPVILQHPQSQSVRLGRTASLSVIASNAITYQWYFHEMPLPEATESTLLIKNVQPEDVGTYHVQAIIRSAATGAFLRVTSRPAVLEIGPVRSIVSQDKIGDLLALASLPSQSQGAGSSLTASSTSSGGIIQVSAGTTGNQIVNNTGSGTGPGEPNSCGKLGNASRWLILSTATAGMEFQIDTGGSSVPTILAVYRSVGILGDRVEQTCAADGSTSNFVAFPAQANTNYWIVVDGAQQTEDIIAINWKLGSAPVITGPPQDLVARSGSAALFQVTAQGYPGPNFQWFTNNIAVTGATSGALTLLNVTAPAAITVVASNFMGAATNTPPAQLIISQPFTFSFARYQTNLIRLVPPDNILSNETFLVEGTTDFITWLPVVTNTLPPIPQNMILHDHTNFTHRFYRAVEWP